MKVEVDVLGSPFLIIRTVSVDVEQKENKSLPIFKLVGTTQATRT